LAKYNSPDGIVGIAQRPHYLNQKVLGSNLLRFTELTKSI